MALKRMCRSRQTEPGGPVPDQSPTSYRPRSVAVSERRVKTGSFPRDDTHQLTVTLANRSVRVITVIDPDASVTEASELMRRLTDADGRPPEDHPEWDNEGGHT